MLTLTDLRPAPAPPTPAAGERLVAAAEELFYRRGIGSVGVDLIADTAGVTKRTLYQRFGSKELLVVAYLQRRARVWQTRLLDALAQTPPTSAAQGVELVFAVAAQWALDNPRGCAFVNAWAELGSSPHRAVPVIRAEKQWMRDLFTRLTDDPSTAAQVHMLYEGAQIAFTTLGEDGAHAQAAAAAAALLTKCIASRTELTSTGSPS